MAFGSAMKSGFEEASLIFVDVGQGDCIHFKTAEGESYLIDGGGKEGYNTGRETLRDYLLKKRSEKGGGSICYPSSHRPLQGYSRAFAGKGW